MSEYKETRFLEEMAMDLDYVFDLPEEMIAAIDKQIPMTWELFLSCIRYCETHSAEQLFFRLLQEYPDYVQKYSEQEN